MTPKLLYTLAEAAEVAGVSVTTLRRAINATDPRSFPPPLVAKRVGLGEKAHRRILATELERWVKALPDA